MKEEIIDFGAVVEIEMNKKLEKLLKTSQGNLMAVFRKNFDAFEKLVRFYKKYPDIAKIDNDNPYLEIKRILEESGVVASGKISEEMVKTYMSRVRSELDIKERKQLCKI